VTTVLIVEDDPDTSELIAFGLDRAGYEVRVASDGTAAMAAAQSADIDLVLLDVVVPGVSGTDVCRRLRAAAHTAGLPIIMVTARARAVDAERAFEAGADDYIVKPFSPRELVIRIEQALARVARAAS